MAADVPALQVQVEMLNLDIVREVIGVLAGAMPHVPADSPLRTEIADILVRADEKAIACEWAALQNLSRAPSARVLDVQGPRATPPRFAAIYIAGPMTGLPEFNYPAFHAAAKRWRDAGWHVENPAENYSLDDPNLSGVPYTTFIRSGLQQLVCGCEAIALLPGWLLSRGAAIEIQVAAALGMAFYDATTMERVRTPGTIALSEADYKSASEI